MDEQLRGIEKKRVWICEFDWLRDKISKLKRNGMECSFLSFFLSSDSWNSSRPYYGVCLLLAIFNLNKEILQNIFVFHKIKTSCRFYVLLSLFVSLTPLSFLHLLLFCAVISYFRSFKFYFNLVLSLLYTFKLHRRFLILSFYFRRFPLVIVLCFHWTVVSYIRCLKSIVVWFSVY